MAKKKYTVQTPVRHDGKDFAPGESIDLDIPEDHALLVDGVIAGGKAVKAAKTSDASAAAQATFEAEAAAAEQEISAASAAFEAEVIAAEKAAEAGEEQGA